MSADAYLISFETARKLKEAGLRWEPKEGDWHHLPKGEGPHPLCGDEGYFPDLVREYGVWASRLDQILAEIKRRGWEVQIGSGKVQWVCEISKETEERMVARWFDHKDNPAEALAQALEWILKRKEV